MRYFFLSILIIFSLTVFAQTPAKKLVQFSGMVLSSDSLQALPYCVIFDKSIRRGTYSNYQGFFSFVAAEGDSIFFQYVGFQNKMIVIPKNLTDERYSMVQLLATDTTNLPVTIIRAYPRPDEFKKAFLDLKVPDDDLARAEKNLRRMSSPDLRMDLPADGREASNTYLRNYASSFYYKGQAPPQAIFNPIAWSEFFNAWKRGDFKKKKYY